MHLTKSDFILYLLCPKSFWLTKREPGKVPQGEFSAFQQQLVREGYEVERYVRALFNQPAQGSAVDFQRTFKTKTGMLARADVFALEKTGVTHPYEVKSSTNIKTDQKQNYLKDACFQLIAAERSGQPISRVSIIQLNGEYIRDGKIVPEELLTVQDVTENVRAIHETGHEVDRVLTMLAEDDIHRSSW